MKKWMEAYRAWRLLQKTRRNQNLFATLFNDPKSNLKDIVQKAGQDLAMKLVMNWQDNHRIIHCSICPNTETLRKHDTMGYLCPGHFNIIMRQPTKQEDLANVTN